MYRCARIKKILNTILSQVRVQRTPAAAVGTLLLFEQGHHLENDIGFQTISSQRYVDLPLSFAQFVLRFCRVLGFAQSIEGVLVNLIYLRRINYATVVGC